MEEEKTESLYECIECSEIFVDLFVINIGEEL